MMNLRIEILVVAGLILASSCQKTDNTDVTKTEGAKEEVHTRLGPGIFGGGGHGGHGGNNPLGGLLNLGASLLGGFAQQVNHNGRPGGQGNFGHNHGRPSHGSFGFGGRPHNTGGDFSHSHSGFGSHGHGSGFHNDHNHGRPQRPSFGFGRPGQQHPLQIFGGQGFFGGRPVQSGHHQGSSADGFGSSGGFGQGHTHGSDGFGAGHSHGSGFTGTHSHSRPGSFNQGHGGSNHGNNGFDQGHTHGNDGFGAGHSHGSGFTGTHSHSRPSGSNQGSGGFDQVHTHGNDGFGAGHSHGSGFTGTHSHSIPSGSNQGSGGFNQEHTHGNNGFGAGHSHGSGFTGTHSHNRPSGGSNQGHNSGIPSGVSGVIIEEDGSGIDISKNPALGSHLSSIFNQAVANSNTNPTEKPGNCPAVRGGCPGTRKSPVICRDDQKCRGRQKCCFDACVINTVCKTAIFTDVSGHNQGGGHIEETTPAFLDLIDLRIKPEEQAAGEGGKNKNKRNRNRNNNRNRNKHNEEHHHEEVALDAAGTDVVAPVPQLGFPE